MSNDFYRAASYRVVKVKKRVIRFVASFVHGGAREESRSSLSRVSKKGIISLSYPPLAVILLGRRERDKEAAVETGASRLFTYLPGDVLVL